MDAEECLDCTAGRTPAPTKSELHKTRNHNSVPLPVAHCLFLYPQQEHSELQPQSMGHSNGNYTTKFDTEHCLCYHCQMLTNKLDSEQTGEFIRTGAWHKAKEHSMRRESNTLKSQRDEWVKEKEIWHVLIKSSEETSKNDQELQVQIEEHSITFNTGEGQLGRWHSRQTELSHFKMKTGKLKKNPNPSKIKPEPTQHCIFSQVLLLTIHCITLMPKRSRGGLLHITLYKGTLLHHGHHPESQTLKKARLKKEEGNRLPGLTCLKLLNFGLKQTYWPALKSWERDGKKHKADGEQVKSAKYTGSLFRAVKLYLLSKGREHIHTQSWNPTQLHWQCRVLLPKSLCDPSKCTGGWQQPNSRMSPLRPPWFVARVCQPSAFTQIILAPRPCPAEKMHFHQRGWEGWWKEQKIMEGQCSSTPLLPRDSLRMAGYHHTRCWLGQANFEVSQRWYSDKGRTDQHPLRLITPLSRQRPFWTFLFSNLWGWAGCLAQLPLHNSPIPRIDK